MQISSQFPPSLFPNFAAEETKACGPRCPLDLQLPEYCAMALSTPCVDAVQRNNSPSKGETAPHSPYVIQMGT